MITQFFLYLIFAVIDISITFLPDVTIPAQITDVLTTVFNSLHYLDLILPMSDLLMVLQLFLACELAILIFKIVEFLYNKVRGAG